MIMTNYTSHNTRSFELITNSTQISPVGTRFASKFVKKMIPTMAATETPTIAVIEIDFMINLEMFET